MTRACEEIRRALRGVADGVTLSIDDEFALHLDTCSRCRREFDLGKIDLPKEGFEVLGEAARRRIVVALGSARVLRPRGRRRKAGLTVAAAILLVALGGIYLTVQRRAADRVAEALVEDHIRYLNHPDRNVGGDPAVLARFLESYVDFPIELVVPPESRLVGGRRCFVLGRRVALVFYETPSGPASYFVFPAEGLRPPGHRCPEDAAFDCATSRGYHLVSWENAGLVHVVVGARQRPLLDMARACRFSNASARPPAAEAEDLG